MSFLIPDSIINANRHMVEKYRLDTQGVVSAITEVPDGSGGYTTTLGTQYTFNMGIATGAKGQSQLEQRLLDRIGNRPYFVLLIPLEVDIQLEYEVTEVGTNRKFHVLAIENDGITLQLLQRVVAVEVE